MSGGLTAVRAADGGGGRVVRSTAVLDAWATEQGAAAMAEPFTFVVGPESGPLRLVPRRSEHVACAADGDVLAAGKIAFRRTPDGC